VTPYRVPAERPCEPPPLRCPIAPTEEDERDLAPLVSVIEPEPPAPLMLDTPAGMAAFLLVVALGALGCAMFLARAF
jgi:hypothetical protein